MTAWTRVFAPLRQIFPDARYHGGQELVGLEQDADRVTARFAKGSTAEAELLIGADGFRSSVRALMAPEITPRYAGYVAWRGLADETALSAIFRAETFDRLVFALAAGSEFNGYPVPGRRHYNFVWYTPVDGGAAPVDLLTDDGGQLHHWSIPPHRIRQVHLGAQNRRAQALLPAAFAEAAGKSRPYLVQPIYDVDAIHYSRWLGSFIERRLDGPEDDPALGWTPERIVESSGRPAEGQPPLPPGF